jgi:aspartyl-tRNA(Asn)/glutamyl-tRNA(Gln) amidotransferase subunit B
MAAYGLPAYDAGVLTTSRELADYFETCLENYSNSKQAANWIMGSLLALLNTEGKDIQQSPISPQALAALLKLIDSNVISGKIAKIVFDEMAGTGKPPEIIVHEKGLVQVTDTSEIENVVQKVLAQSPKEVLDYQNGKEKIFGFFVGQVMRETKGKANPQRVNEILKIQLGMDIKR